MVDKYFFLCRLRYVYVLLYLCIILSWSENIKITLEFLRNTQIENNLQQVQNSTHGIYQKLNKFKGHTYFTDEFNKYKIAWTFKIRAGMIGLNADKIRTGYRRICSLCNLNEEEDVMHFVGRCPILKTIRKKYLIKDTLEENEIIAILDGESEQKWDILYKFVIEAFWYRKNLINEFNY